MATQIITQLENALGETVSLLSSFNEKELNTVPFKGSWTAAQVGRHLFKAEDGLNELFYTTTQPATRQPDEKAEEFKKILLDFNLKMDSPDFLLPETKEYDKHRLIDALSGIKSTVLEAATNADLNYMAPLPQGHPLEGSTKLEIVHFMAYHTIRHNHQIKKIREAIQA
ncbi:DinB family protein [Flavobacterium zepuense]|uniref:DinB family protein n=1 Tax=Flavobacterium zepuense TaxID=2593302 RepID=A0A552V497_9FLAO|nr:DinB family protein [Flavobacterium zepuense]TRW25268.1 DinB family protein [Flavobacterium zepuense]